MVKRRDFIKLAVATSGAAAVKNAGADEQSGLLFPQTQSPSIISRPSPPVTPFIAPLNEMPVAQTVEESELVPPPDPESHQRWDDFPVAKFYRESIEEVQWNFHPDAPYNQGTAVWAFNGYAPGETYHANYGEPIFLRRENNLPPIGTGIIEFALPSITIHLHNAHTASESDGIPTDYFNPGEYWDHHYCNFPAGFDDREIMSTLWYHDHRLDFTATNVYAGLSGFYLLFDEKDSNNEEDTNPKAFRLPSGKYDVPMVLHDAQFDEDASLVWDFFNPAPDASSLPTENYTTNGMVGDRFTVNRVIQPYFQVEARKYRFRVLNGGPSRLYSLSLRQEADPGVSADEKEKFFIISTDGNLLERPLKSDNINLWVAQRHDIVVDFSKYTPGSKLYLANDLEMRTDGAGITGRRLEENDLIMRFDVIPATGRDPSRVPKKMRRLPKIDLSEVRRERLFVFDYDNGLWTINGKLMDPNRVDAAIEKGSAEIWTFRNAGNAWVHPIHTHFEEFRILEVNGRQIKKNDILNSRKDVVALGPNDEVKFFSRWRDFEGKHVMHCHNVVHEDHAMMLRWDIVPVGEGD